MSQFYMFGGVAHCAACGLALGSPERLHMCSSVSHGPIRLKQAHGFVFWKHNDRPSADWQFATCVGRDTGGPNEPGESAGLPSQCPACSFAYIPNPIRGESVGQCPVCELAAVRSTVEHLTRECQGLRKERDECAEACHRYMREAQANSGVAKPESPRSPRKLAGGWGLVIIRAMGRKVKRLGMPIIKARE